MYKALLQNDAWWQIIGQVKWPLGTLALGNQAEGTFLDNDYHSIDITSDTSRLMNSFTIDLTYNSTFT